MSVRRRALRLLALLGACMLFGLSAGFAWSVVDDYSQREIVPDGVSALGADLGGLTREEARLTLSDAVAASYFEPVVLRFDDRSFAFDPEHALSVDVDSMLTEAFGPASSTTVAERTYRRLTGEPITVDVEARLSIDGESLDTWIDSIASQIDTPSVDATVTLVDDRVVIQSSSIGLRTDRAAASKLLTEALLEGVGEIALPVEELLPTATEKDLGRWVLVDLSERHAYLYHGTEVFKDYGVAIGAPGYGTPRGEWEITLKRYMPTWRNPGSAWAADMPASIPPGAGNPLGTRAINLSAPGIRFHGTTEDWSIGRAASHGCMRMHRWDVEDLYEEVEVGDKVFIVS